MFVLNFTNFPRTRSTPSHTPHANRIWKCLECLPVTHASFRSLQTDSKWCINHWVSITPISILWLSFQILFVLNTSSLQASRASTSLQTIYHIIKSHHYKQDLTVYNDHGQEKSKLHPFHQITNCFVWLKLLINTLSFNTPRILGKEIYL